MNPLINDIYSDEDNEDFGAGYPEHFNSYYHYVNPRHDIPEVLEHITTERNEYEMQIDRALLMRRTQTWPLWRFDQWSKFKLPKYYWEKLPVQERPGRITNMQYQACLEDMTEKFLIRLLNKRFPCVESIMDAYPGKVYPCGGFFTNPFQTYDIDLFFVNCTEEECSSIMLHFEELFVKRHSKGPISFYRTSGATSFMVKPTYDIRSPYDVNKCYQFIHRIYPSLPHILGGFDLQCSMIAYDGSNVVANEMGSFCFVNKTIVLDISRASTSMVYRLKKYYYRGFDIVLPGIYHAVLQMPEAKRTEDVNNFQQELQLLKEKYDICLAGGVLANSRLRCEEVDYYDDYGYGKALQGDDSKIYDRRSYTSFLGFSSGLYESDSPKDRRYERITDSLLLTFRKANDDTEIERDGHSDYAPNPKSFFRMGVEENIAHCMIDHPENVCVSHVYDNDTGNGISYALRDRKIYSEVTIDKHDRILKGVRKTLYNENPKKYSGGRHKDITWGQINPYIEIYKETHSRIASIQWITQDPGRQWSSTVNPVILDAQKFYKGKWNGLCAVSSYNYPLYKMLRLDSLYNPKSVFRGIPKDLLIFIVNIAMWI